MVSFNRVAIDEGEEGEEERREERREVLFRRQDSRRSSEGVAP